MKAKQQGFEAKQPDIMIFSIYGNLALELKTMKADTNTNHCKEQKEYLENLYHCGFKSYMTRGLVVNIELLEEILFLGLFEHVTQHQNIVAKYA